MKKTAIVLLIALFLIAGCTQQAAVQTEPQAAPAAAPAVQQSDVIQVVEKDTSVLSDEITSAIDSQLSPGVKSTFPLRFAKLAKGEKFTFGLGIQNIMNIDTKFRVDVFFDKAQDKMMNTIPTDEDTMNTWIKTQLDEFDLPKGAKETVSIVIEVGDIKPGVAVVPGSYIFDVETYYADNGRTVNDEYVGKVEIAIKVE